MLEVLRLPAGWAGYLSVFMMVLGSLGIGGMLKTWLDHRFKNRKQTDDMATAIVTSTTDRMRAVERHGRVCEANLSFMRHRYGNLSGSFNSMLLMIKLAPDKIPEIVDVIIEQRREQQKLEADERNTLMAATLAFDDEHGEQDNHQQDVGPDDT